MSKKFFLFFLAVILIIQLIVRLAPAQNYNFYFTVDQGDDAVHVREITEYGRLLLKGPETGIKGVYAGPGWYYFLAPFYFIFSGDPFAGLLAIIILNLATTLIVVWQVGKRVSYLSAIMLGIALQFFWHFYDFSRYQFNPFPLVLLTLIQILLYINLFLGGKKSYYYALIPVIFAFNFEVAGAAVLFTYHLAVGAYLLFKKKISLTPYLLVNFALPLVLLSPLIMSLSNQLLNSSIVNPQLVSNRGIFSGTNFIFMGERFLEILQRSIIPQSATVSLFALLVLSAWIFKAKSNKFVRIFFVNTAVLFLASYLFFSLSKGWQDWHTVYLYVMVFISLVLIALSLPKKASIILFFIFVIFHGQIFNIRYNEYVTAGTDPGLLINQIKVVDWIYSDAMHGGFNVYTYTVHRYDYNYQYLFSWRGKSEFGYLPCEYSLLPGYLKSTYILNPEDYSKPTLGCNDFYYLIIESGKTSEIENWMSKINLSGIIEKEKFLGEIRVLKFKIKPQL